GQLANRLGTTHGFGERLHVVAGGAATETAREHRPVKRDHAAADRQKSQERRQIAVPDQRFRRPPDLVAVEQRQHLRAAVAAADRPAQREPALWRAAAASTHPRRAIDATARPRPRERSLRAPPPVYRDRPSRPARRRIPPRSPSLPRAAPDIRSPPPSFPNRRSG